MVDLKTLIVDAITDLNDRNGSSRYAIKKYIIQNAKSGKKIGLKWSDKVATNFRNELKSGVSHGLFVQVSCHNFKLSEELKKKVCGLNETISFESRIVDAIQKLNNKEGSSIFDIKSQMQTAQLSEEYSDNRFLEEFQSGIERGVIVQSKQLFKIAESVEKATLVATESILSAPVTAEEAKDTQVVKGSHHKSETFKGDESKDLQQSPGDGWTNGAIPPIMYLQSNDGQAKLYQSFRRWIRTSTSWSRTGSGDPNDAVAVNSTGDKMTACPIQEGMLVKALICQLSEKFFSLGWKPGTGGGLSIRIGEGTASSPYRVFSTPSGLLKEDMIGDDIFEMDMEQRVTQVPKTPGLKLSSMTSLWFIIYKLRPSTTCVIHTHSMNAQLATMIDPTETKDELLITHLEMIKGVGNHAYDDMLKIPIIANQTSEDQLGPDIEQAILNYPKCNAVLVRRHGVYVWGDTWEQAKTQLESFDYLFQSAREMKSLGVDCGLIPHHSSSKSLDRSPPRPPSVSPVRSLSKSTSNSSHSSKQFLKRSSKRSSKPSSISFPIRSSKRFLTRSSTRSYSGM